MWALTDHVPSRRDSVGSKPHILRRSNELHPDRIHGTSGGSGGARHARHSQGARILDASRSPAAAPVALAYPRWAMSDVPSVIEDGSRSRLTTKSARAGRCGPLQARRAVQG
jgi:hypothetical protein